MVRLVNIVTDQPSRCAAYENIGGEVVVGKYTADAHGRGQAIDHCSCKPAGVFVGDYSGQVLPW